MQDDPACQSEEPSLSKRLMSAAGNLDDMSSIQVQCQPAHFSHKRSSSSGPRPLILLVQALQELRAIHELALDRVELHQMHQQRSAQKPSLGASEPRQHSTQLAGSADRAHSAVIHTAAAAFLRPAQPPRPSKPQPAQPARSAQPALAAEHARDVEGALVVGALRRGYEHLGASEGGYYGLWWTGSGHPVVTRLVAWH